MTAAHPEPDTRADVAHELRSALHTIVGHAALLDGQSGDEREQRSVSSIVGAARRAAAILEAARLLDDREATAGSVYTNLDDALARCAEAHRRTFASRRIEIHVGSGDDGSTAEGPASTRCDRSTVDVVLDLLLCWAVLRAEPDSALRLDLIAEQSTTSPTFRLHVRIEGRVDVQRDATLRIVGRLLRDAGGDLRPGADPTSLELRFPAAATIDAPAPTLADAGADCGARADVVASPAQVLVVDDDEHSRAFVELTLVAAGCAVHTAGDLDGARAALAEHDIDVLVADQHLATDRGIDLLHEVRTEGRRCRIYLATGDLDPQLDAEVKALGGEVLHKPVDLDVLLAIATSAATTTDAR